MRIEVVEFYPRPHKSYLGDLHVYIIDEDIDLRGVNVWVNKSGIYFTLPAKRTTDLETGQPVRFPFFCYASKEKTKLLIDKIIEQGTEYINKNYPHVVEEGRARKPSKKKDSGS